jgi:hypothetical protein
MICDGANMTTLSPRQDALVDLMQLLVPRNQRSEWRGAHSGMDVTA